MIDGIETVIILQKPNKPWMSTAQSPRNPTQSHLNDAVTSHLTFGRNYEE
jgi:hypothetical protein